MIIFLYGVDDYRREAKKREIVAEFRKRHSNLGLMTFDLAEEGGSAKLREFLANQSLFQSAKMAVLDSAFEIEAPSSAKASAGKKENLLSISVKAYGEPKLVVKVDKRYFSPEPAVNSAIIKISGIGRKMFVENKVNEGIFWQIVKAGFAHKRKKLSGNLKSLCQGSTLTSLGDKRAEDLTLTDWISLARGLKPSA